MMASRDMADVNPHVITPLGRVVMTVDDGVSIVGDREADDARLLPRGGRVLTYRARAFEADLLLGDISPRLPPHMHVERCVAGVWRIRTRELLPSLRFRCSCIELPEDADFDSASGECLDALIWENSDWVMSIGTQDGECLSGRALRGDNMPRALADQLELATIEYSSNGLCVPMTNVPANEMVQVHFLVAWAVRSETENLSTWYAVDRKSGWILAQLTAE